MGLTVLQIADEPIQVLGKMGLRETIEIKYDVSVRFDKQSNTCFIEVDVDTTEHWIKAI